MIKLNLGCGNDIREGFINIDLRYDVSPDIVCSLDNLPFTTEYADLIVCQDVLEHFNYLELQIVLSEIYRVLKTGGTLEIRSPDAEHIINKYCKKELTIHDTLSYLYGGIDYHENNHKIGFTQEKIKRLLESHGFKVYEVFLCDAINFHCKVGK